VKGKTSVLIIGTRQRLTAKEIIALRRQSAIEVDIGHMKTDGRLSRSTLKGTIGDAVFAILHAFGHNIRKILSYHRGSLAYIMAMRWTAETATMSTRIQREGIVQCELQKKLISIIETLLLIMQA
jgi:hypothetical protein